MDSKDSDIFVKELIGKDDDYVKLVNYNSNGAVVRKYN
jgi:hypothetical protein